MDWSVVETGLWLGDTQSQSPARTSGQWAFACWLQLSIVLILSSQIYPGGLTGVSVAPCCVENKGIVHTDNPETREATTGERRTDRQTDTSDDIQGQQLVSRAESKPWDMLQTWQSGTAQVGDFLLYFISFSSAQPRCNAGDVAAKISSHNRSNAASQAHVPTLLQCWFNVGPPSQTVDQH